jgi:hypothetical protein
MRKAMKPRSDKTENKPEQPSKGKSGSSEDRKIIVQLQRDVLKIERAGEQRVDSRQAQIAERKKIFSDISKPVEEAITRVGGKVTGRAWINGTLQATVPANSVDQISELDEVERIAEPRALEPDTKA